MPKDSSNEFQKVFSELNATNRKYALAVLRSLLFAHEEKQRGAKAETPEPKNKEKPRNESE